MPHTPQPADEKHLEPYRAAVARFGPSFEATLWQSREAQALRFKVMVETIGRSALEGCRLLDIGCGTGDLAQYLLGSAEDRGARTEQSGSDRGDFEPLGTRHSVPGTALPFERYVGLDAMPEMIAAAKQRGLPGCEFAVVNVFDDLRVFASYKPDFAFLSGTLNTMDEGDAKRLVGHAFEASAQGVVFNFLSNRHHPRFAAQPLDPARRFDTVGWLDWAMSNTPRVSFAQDYLDGHDATILMRHG